MLLQLLRIRTCIFICNYFVVILNALYRAMGKMCINYFVSIF